MWSRRSAGNQMASQFLHVCLPHLTVVKVNVDFSCHDVGFVKLL